MPDLRRAVALGTPDAIVVNFAVLGGIGRAVRFIGACEAMGVDFWCYSGDTGVCTAAYLHVSAAMPWIREPSQSLFRWQAGDVIDRNLLPHVSKRLKRGLIGGESDADLAGLMDRLVLNLRTAASLFMTEDARVARQLAEEKVAFRRAEREAVTAHFDVMRADRAAQGMQSAIHLDLLRDMKLINSLIVAAAAYPVLDRAGELLPTRLVVPYHRHIRPQGGEYEIRYSDYREVNGVKLPYRIVRRSLATENAPDVQWTASSYQVNLTFDAKTFEPLVSR